MQKADKITTKKTEEAIKSEIPSYNPFIFLIVRLRVWIIYVSQTFAKNLLVDYKFNFKPWLYQSC